MSLNDSADRREAECVEAGVVGEVDEDLV